MLKHVLSLLNCLKPKSHKIISIFPKNRICFSLTLLLIPCFNLNISYISFSDKLTLLPTLGQTPGPQPASNAVLEERIKLLREDILKIVQWTIGLTIGLYTILLGYNFYKSIIQDKKDKENLKEEVLDELKKFLREEVIPETEKKLSAELKEELDQLQIALCRVERGLTWTRYKLAVLSAEASARESVYHYQTAIQEHLCSINILQELNSQETEELLEYTLKAIRQLLEKLAKLTQDLETSPSLTEEHIHQIQAMLDKLPPRYVMSKAGVEELLAAVRPLIKPELSLPETKS